MKSHVLDEKLPRKNPGKSKYFKRTGYFLVIKKGKK